MHFSLAFLSLGYACGRTNQPGMLTVVRRSVPGSTRPRRGAAAAAVSAQSSSSNIYQTSTSTTGENISATIPTTFRPNSNSGINNNCSIGTTTTTTTTSGSGGGGSGSSCGVGKPRSFALLDAAGPTSRSSTSSSQYSHFGSPSWAGTRGGQGVASRNTESPKARAFSASSIDLRVTSYCARPPGGSNRGGRGRCVGGVPSAAAGADMVINVRKGLENFVLCCLRFLTMSGNIKLRLYEYQ